MRIAKPERHRDRRSQEQEKAAAITHTSPESEKLSTSHSTSKSLSHLPYSGLMIVSIYLHRYQLPPQSHISFPTNDTKKKKINSKSKYSEWPLQGREGKINTMVFECSSQAFVLSARGEGDHQVKSLHCRWAHRGLINPFLNWDPKMLYFSFPGSWRFQSAFPLDWQLSWSGKNSQNAELHWYIKSSEPMSHSIGDSSHLILTLKPSSLSKLMNTA